MKETDTVVLSANLFRVLVANYPPDLLEYTEPLLSACSGRTREIIREELGMLNVPEKHNLTPIYPMCSCDQEEF